MTELTYIYKFINFIQKYSSIELEMYKPGTTNLESESEQGTL
jgi:hypothetical protein